MCRIQADPLRSALKIAGGAAWMAGPSPARPARPRPEGSGGFYLHHGTLWPGGLHRRLDVPRKFGFPNFLQIFHKFHFGRFKEINELTTPGSSARIGNCQAPDYRCCSNRSRTLFGRNGEYQWFSVQKIWKSVFLKSSPRRVRRVRMYSLAERAKTPRYRSDGNIPI